MHSEAGRQMTTPNNEAIDAALTAFSDEIAKVGSLHKDALIAALTAAAPFIMAQAWEEGWAHYRMHFSPNDPEYGANPYRSGT